MSVISVYQTDLEYALRGAGFTTRKIEQFLKAFSKETVLQGVVCSLDSQRAMLVNVQGTEQGLCLSDFITAWWSFWVVVFNTTNNPDLEQQSLGAIRALFFISSSCRSVAQQTMMQTWWRDFEPEHGSPMMEAL